MHNALVYLLEHLDYLEILEHLEILDSLEKLMANYMVIICLLSPV